MRSSATAASVPAGLPSSLPPASRAFPDTGVVMTRGELVVVVGLFLAGALLDWVGRAGARLALGRTR